MNDYDKEKINLECLIVSGCSFEGHHGIFDKVSHAVHHNKVWRPVQDGIFDHVFESRLQRCVRIGVEAYEY